MALTYDTEVYLRTVFNDFGVTPAEVGLQYQQDAFTGNGATVNFTLSHTPSSNFITLVYLQGILQTASQVTISGTTVTFAVAPPNGNAIVAVYSY